MSRQDSGEDLIALLNTRSWSGAAGDFLLEAVYKTCFNQARTQRGDINAIRCTAGSAAN